MEKKKGHYIIGNWKMNPDNRKEAKKLFAGVRKASQRRKATVVVCPPFLYLSDMSSESFPKSLKLGAQDCFWKERGSQTGEISPVQLAELKVSYVIIGHSERRLLGESDEMVSDKVRAVLDAGMRPVVCIGESNRDGQGNYLQFLETQLDSAFSKVTPAEVDTVIVAYEPIWAIGQSDEDAITGHLLHEVVVFVRRFLARKYGKDIGFPVSVIYGGSVSPRNAEEILKDGNVDGLLIGRQSLASESFSEIIDLADSL